MEINIVPVELEALPRKTKAVQVEVQTAPVTIYHPAFQLLDLLRKYQAVACCDDK
jgi:hypothetical protein